MHKQFKEIQRAYGFDDVAIAPGEVTINPDQVSTEFTIGSLTIKTPVLASAMDCLLYTSDAADE